MSGYRLRSGEDRELSELQVDFLDEAIVGLSVLGAIPTGMFGAVLRYIDLLADADCVVPVPLPRNTHGGITPVTSYK